MRIVSLLPGLTEMVYALGLGRDIVGVSHECDFPPDVRAKSRLTRSNIDSNQSSQAIDEQVQGSLAAGLPLYAVDVERLAAARPDVILTQAQCDVCAVKYADVVAAVAQCPTLARTNIVSFNPARLTDLPTDLRRIGDACGCRATADQVVTALQTRLAAVGRAVAGLPAPRVACIEWLAPLMLAGNWVPDLIEAAGGQNGLTRAGVHSPYAQWSAVAAYDPDVLLIAPCGFDLDRTLIEWSRLQRSAYWNSLSAVRTNRVFAIDGNALFNRFGPRLVDTVELLSTLLHPQLTGVFALPNDAPPYVVQIDSG